ncbi:MAG TPA: hypothetical protein VFW22_17485 [Pseudolabrys sp.]|nr:hypothetical protein [Pseudolabrys sp.]
MPNIDGAWLNGLASTPLTLGAVAALLVALAVLAVMRAGVARRLLASVVALGVVSAGVFVILDRQVQNERAADRRALTQRLTELSATVLAPGSALACLDGAAGEAVENACEKVVFAAPQATAGAVSYMAARLTLLADGLAFARNGDADFAATMSSLRRAIELDRFGVAAHVLAVRDGCTAERCAAFALLHDASVIKANLKAQVFNQYVSRYATDWDKSPPVAVKEAPQVPVASVGEQAAPTKAPVPEKYELPSAASIPPVSIMNPEPPLPKEAKDAQAQQPPQQQQQQPPHAVPAPPKRPPVQAEAPPAAAPMPLR